MKRLMLVVMVLLALVSAPSWAGCSLDNVSLPDLAKKQLELECVKMQQAADDAANKTVDTEKISKYAGIATEVATAIGIAAKNLGVEVNNFITTPAGMLTVSVILIKIFGKLFGLALAALVINILVWKILVFLWHEDEKDEQGNRKYYTRMRGFGFFQKQIYLRKRISFKNASESLVGWSLVLIVLSLGSIILVPAAGL